MPNEIQPRIDKDRVGWCVRECPHKGIGPFYTYHCQITGQSCQVSLCLPYARQREARIKELEAIVDKLPKDDSIRTALAANGSMKDGEVVYDESYCMCDASVGMSPCGYCAIHDALRKTFEAREAAEKAKEKK